MSGATSNFVKPAEGVLVDQLSNGQKSLHAAAQPFNTDPMGSLSTPVRNPIYPLYNPYILHIPHSRSSDPGSDGWVKIHRLRRWAPAPRSWRNVPRRRELGGSESLGPSIRIYIHI